MEIVVASGKGGVGKSTVSSTLAIFLHKNHDIVAIDADADAPNLHLILGVEKWEYEEPLISAAVAEINYDKCTNCGICMDVCTYDAIKFSGNKYVINEMICEGCRTCQYVCPERAISIRPAESGIVRRANTKYGFPLISARLHVGKANTGKLVTREKDLAKEMDKELRLVDAAAGIGCQVVASLAGANLAVLVAEPTPASINDLRRIYALTRHFMIPSTIIINKHDLHPKHAEEIERFAEKEGVEILGRIPYDELIPRSMAQMKPYIEIYPNTEAAHELKKVARRVEEIISNWDEWFKERAPKEPKAYIPKILKPSEMGKGTV